MQLSRIRNIKSSSIASGAEMGINTVFSIQGGAFLETMAWLAIQIIANKLIVAMKLAQTMQVSTSVKTSAKVGKFFADNLSTNGNVKPVPVQSSWIHSVAYMPVNKLKGSIVVYFKQNATNKKAPIISLPMYSSIDFSRFIQASSKGKFYLDNIALKTPGGKLSTNFIAGFVAPAERAFDKKKFQEFYHLRERSRWAKQFLEMSPKDRQRHRMVLDPQTNWVGSADTFMEKYGFASNNREAMRSELNITEMNNIAGESIKEFEMWMAKEATKKRALDRIRKFNDFKRKVTKTKRLASNPMMYAKAQARRKTVGKSLEGGYEKDRAKKLAITADTKMNKVQKAKKRAKIDKSRRRKNFLAQGGSKGLIRGNITSGFKRQSRQSGRKRAIRSTKRLSR